MDIQDRSFSVRRSSVRGCGRVFRCVVGLFSVFCCVGWVGVSPPSAQGVLIKLSQPVDGLEEFDTQYFAKTELEELVAKLRREYPSEYGNGNVSKIRQAITSGEYYNSSVMVTSAPSAKLSRQASRVEIFAGTGQRGNFLDPIDPTKTELRPFGIASLSDGRVLITDMLNHRVLLVSAAGDSIKVFAGTGEWNSDMSMDSTNPTKTQLKDPVRIAVLPDQQNVLIVDGGHRVLVVLAGKGIGVYAGTGYAGDGKGKLDPSDPTKTDLWGPQGVAALPDGRVVIADRNNNRVLMIYEGNHVSHVSVLAGTGYQKGNFDPDDPTSTHLLDIRAPTGVAALPDGRIAVTEGCYGGKLLIISADGKQIKTLNTELNDPSGLAVLPDGRLLIADSRNNRVLMVSPDGGPATVLAGTGCKGNFVDPDDPTNTQLDFPSDIAVLPDGRILIVDYLNHRVLSIYGVKDQ